MSTRKDAAIAMATDRGWEIFPLRPKANIAYKTAATSNGRRWGATRDPDEIERDWERWPRANVGLPTGPDNGIVVLDADTLEGHGVDGLATIRDLEETHGAFPTTLTAISPSGSVHRYFKYPEGRMVRNSTGAVGPGVDVRGVGGMVVAPPSNRKGGEYRWLDPAAEIADLPEWLLNLIGSDQEEVRPNQWNNRPPVDDAELAAAVAAVPNPPSNGWNEWNNMGMAIWRATDGSELGLELFDEWSKKWGEGYKSSDTIQRWSAYDRTPPDRIGVGTIMYLADQANPGWRKLHSAREAVDADQAQVEMGGSDNAEVGGDGGGSETPRGKIRLKDFYANMEGHDYIYAPTGSLWPAASLNSRFGKVPLVDSRGEAIVDDDGEQKNVPAATWLDVHRPVEQMLWAPSEAKIIRDKHLIDGGWIRKGGAQCYNLYRPPLRMVGGVATEARRWTDHVHKLYGEETGDHIVLWLAQRAQRPGVKINHALVLLGDQGIGKDTLLEPVKHAVGPWNFADVSPHDILSAYTGFMQSTILRINEARDLGDVNRYQFYEKTKTMMAAPPDVYHVNEKYIKQRAVLNCTGVILTTNRKDSLFLPEDDRRHFVAHSELTRQDYSEGYWTSMWAWYDAGGFGAVTALLREISVEAFDAKAPPPKTHAFWEIVESSRSGETSEMGALIVALSDPPALTMGIAAERAAAIPALSSFYEWLTDRRNQRARSRVLSEAGYVPVKNDDASNGLWRVGGEKCIIYAKADLPRQERIVAARDLARRGGLAEPEAPDPGPATITPITRGRRRRE